MSSFALLCTYTFFLQHYTIVVYSSYNMCVYLHHPTFPIFLYPASFFHEQELLLTGSILFYIFYPVWCVLNGVLIQEKRDQIDRVVHYWQSLWWQGMAWQASMRPQSIIIRVSQRDLYCLEYATISILGRVLWHKSYNFVRSSWDVPKKVVLFFLAYWKVSTYPHCILI